MEKSSLDILSPETIRLLKRHNLLKAIIRSEIVYNEVMHIDIEKNLSDALFEGYLKKENILSDADLEYHLRKKGINSEDLRWNLELPYRIKQHSISKFGHKSEARFLARKESLDAVVYSLIRTKDAFLARELYLRIAAKEDDFENIASQYSTGKESQSKGIIGPVSLKQSHPLLSEKLRTSKPGELLEPFQVETWWIVVRLENFIPAKFEKSTSEAMSQELFKEWVEEQVFCKVEEF